MHPHTRPQRTSTSLQKGQKRVTDKHTYNIRARSLARAHKHTHTLYTHTHRHVHTHTHSRSRNASLHERTEILTSNLKTKYATYADMYTHPQLISISLQKGQKRVTD